MISKELKKQLKSLTFADKVYVAEVLFGWEQMWGEVVNEECGYEVRSDEVVFATRLAAEDENTFFEIDEDEE